MRVDVTHSILGQRHNNIPTFLRMLECCELGDFSLVALFAVDNFRAFRRVARFEFVGAMIHPVEMVRVICIYRVLGCLPYALARALPEFHWVSLAQSPEMAATGAKCGNGNIHLLIQLKFHGDHAECFRTLVGCAKPFMLTLDDLFED